MFVSFEYHRISFLRAFTACLRLWIFFNDNLYVFEAPRYFGGLECNKDSKFLQNEFMLIFICSVYVSHLEDKKCIFQRDRPIWNKLKDKTNTKRTKIWHQQSPIQNRRWIRFSGRVRIPCLARITRCESINSIPG